MFTCNVCSKAFNARRNYIRHVARHNDANQHQCNECGKVFARQDSYLRHLSNQHPGVSIVQTGQGAPSSDESPPKRQRLTDNVRDMYSVTRKRQVDMKKFRTKGQEYTLKFHDNLDIHDRASVLLILQRVFQSVIDAVTDGAQPRDLIRLVVVHPELDYPITLPFMQKQNLTADRFLSEVERVLQSYEEFSIDGTLEIHVTHVAMPHGGKHRKKKYVDLERFLKEKQCVIQITNKDELCCARAIITAKARMEKHKKWEAIRKGCDLQRTHAEQLHRQAGVPFGKCGINEIKEFQRVLPNYQIIVASKDFGNAVIYRGPSAEKQIYLYHYDGHYDVITSMPSFLNRSYFCVDCMKGYDHKLNHRCENTCKLCFQGKCVEEEWVYCNDCNRSFKSPMCYQNHLKQTKSSESVCKLFYRCRECSQFVSVQKHNKKQHKCGEKYCNVCKEYVQYDHLCFMQPVMDNPDGENVEGEGEQNEFSCYDGDDDDDDKNGQVDKYIFFDFECIQESGIHQPNLCIAHKVCIDCLDSDNATSCRWCSQREHVFQGPSTREDFCKWLFAEENAGAIVLCHNFKGYDSYFVLRYLYDNAVLPEVIFNGAKVMSIKVETTDMRFIDSFNFLPMALSKLPSAFGLVELAKGYFPHLFNTTANQNVVLSHLPDMRYYNPDGMSPAAREKFVKWYDSHREDEFDFQQEIVKYCRSDVDILRRCCLQFRGLFMEMTADDTHPGIDPFKQCITIASACNLVYRTKYLAPDTIGIIPPHGYPSNDRQSVKALQWLKWVSHETNQYIQHAANQGEKHIGKYKADGYYEQDDIKTVLEFHGCLHHGHTCLARDTKHPLNDMTMEDLYHRTLEKRTYIISQGFRYIEKWECEFDAELKQNQEMSAFISSLEIPTPLVPRDAFCGGRTNATKLHYSTAPNEKIKYVDFTSLYPYVNKYGKYPVGHPKVITENFGDISEYEGLVKCKVLPPKELYHPVLPYKASGRLMFPLCRTCCETLSQSSCGHGEDERALTGTWVTLELNKAIEKGYQLLNIYEVWHFGKVSHYDPETKKGGLFSEYVNAFLKLKQEASDWPHWCHTEEQKSQYIQQYLDKEGIELDPNSIRKNPGMRALAKLMLNSFWGKFGQRPNMSKTTYIKNPTGYFDLMTQDETQVHNVSFVNEEMVKVQWQHTEDFVESSGRTNVIVAAYTTAQARLKLYDLLESLDRRVLYYDTDSVIYSVREGEWEPELGDFLGELTNELESDNHIVEFASGGPKNYAYRLAKADKNGNVSYCKVRGISLNYRNGFLVNFDTISQMVQEKDSGKVQVVDPCKITRNKKTMNIETRTEKKYYQVVYTKRVPVANFDTLPYGY